MKKLVLLTLLGAFFLGGCAATAQHSKEMKVKCPACGYEFEVPAPTP